EAAERLGRRPWTVRQWCNKGQVRGARKVHGKGRTGEWRIPHDEGGRPQNEGPSRAGSCPAARTTPPWRPGRSPALPAEDLAEGVERLPGEQVPVAPPHVLGLVAHHLVDDLLPRPGRGEVRGERVAEDVEATDHRPLAPCQVLLEMVGCLSGG